MILFIRSIWNRQIYMERKYFIGCLRLGGLGGMAATTNVYGVSFWVIQIF